MLFRSSFPLCYDSSASGHLDAGEDYDACAKRELYEELDLTAGPLIRLFKIDACAETGQEFVWVYRLDGDLVPVPNPAEIESGRYWSLAEVRAALADRPKEFARSFRHIFAHFERLPAHAK